jgi:hypothetical protein
MSNTRPVKLPPWIERVLNMCTLCSHIRMKDNFFGELVHFTCKVKPHKHLLCFNGICACWMEAFYVGNFTD